MSDLSSLFETEPAETLPKRKRSFHISWKRLIFSLILVALLILIGFFGFRFLPPLLGPQIGGLLKLLVKSEQNQNQPSPTPVLPTPLPLISTPTTTVPTATRPLPTATEQTKISGCLDWSEVTLDLVGENVCVVGEYEQYFQRQDGTYVMQFNEAPGAFHVWSFPKSFAWWLKENPGHCVVIRGWVNTSGVRPIIILGSKGTLEPCSPEQ